MSKSKNIAPDVAIAGLGHVFHKLASFVTIAILARYTDHALMGQFFLAITITTVVAALTELGTSSHLVRSVARDGGRAAGYLAAVLCVRLPLTVAAVLGTTLVVWIAAPAQAGIYLLVSIYVIGTDLYYALGSVLIGLGHFTSRVLTGLVGPVLLLALVPAGVWFGFELPQILLAYAGSSLLMLLVAWRVVVTRTPGAWQMPSRRAVATVLYGSLPLFVMSVLALIHARTDEVMLAMFRGFEEVAVYAAGYRIFEVSRTLIRPMTMVMFPLLAATAATFAWRTLMTDISRVTRWSAAAGALLTLCVVPLAGWIVPTIFGEAYEATVPVTQVLFLSAPVLFVGYAVTLVAKAMNLDGPAIAILTGGVIANVLLNLIVIPTYGAIGAAWTTLVTESMIAAGILGLIVLTLRMRLHGEEAA